MRLLHLTYFLKWGGLERQMLYLLKELAARGHEVHVGFFQEGHMGGRDEMNGLHLHQIRKYSHYDPLVVLRLMHLIRTVNPDVIQTWHYLMDVFGGAACRILHKPWILRDALPGMGDHGIVKGRLRRMLAGRADRVVANSVAGMRYWHEHCPKARVQHISNGVPLREIERLASSGLDLFGEEDQPFIIHVGQLIARKNVATLVEALEHVVKHVPAFALFCGDGPERTRLEAMARQRRLTENVRFVGHLPKEQVWQLLKKARALVFLSAHEGCPNVVLEAMACQCPLVLSNIPEHRELAGEHAARMVDHHDACAVGHAIMDVLANPCQAQRRAEAARKQAQVLGIDAMAQKYLHLYANVRRPAAA